MPTYEYACSKCGHHFEKFQSMRDEPLRKCPKCSKAALKRLVGGGAGLIFKGSGFYITDYRKTGYGEGRRAPSPSRPPEAKARRRRKAGGGPAPRAAPRLRPPPAARPAR